MSATADNAWQNEAPLIAHDPPPWFARALAWTLISMFVIAALAAIVVHIPETVRARFTLVSDGGANPIQSPRPAVVESALVKPGQTVKKGDRLFVLRIDAVRDWRTETESRRDAVRALEQNSAKLEEAHAAALRIKDGEIDQAQREVVFRGQHLAIMQDLVARCEKLAATGLISQIELASQRLARAQSEKDLELARKTLQQRQLEREAAETERRRQRISEKAAADDLRLRIAALQQPLEMSANGSLEIRAPYDAAVVSVNQQSAGGVLAAGEELCQLSPLSSRVQARLDVPETGLSQLNAKQRVRLLFDAYPYQRYGVATGAIDWISPAAVTRGAASEFIALASLDKQTVTSGRHVYQLRPGMKGEARVIVGRRALIEYAFEPLRELRENLK